MKAEPDMNSPQGLRFVRYKNDPKNPNSISSNDVYFTYQDSQGRIWVGLLGGGLNLISEANGTIAFKHKYNGLKQYFFFLLFSIAMLLFACTNDQESDLLPSKEAKGTVDMLNFATEEEFFNAVESPEATLNTISTHSDFKSLYNEYEEAWEIEEEYYASEK